MLESGDGRYLSDTMIQRCNTVSSPGVQKNEPYDALNSITTNGLGLVNPEKVFSFYNELHSYLCICWDRWSEGGRAEHP